MLASSPAIVASYRRPMAGKTAGRQSSCGVRRKFSNDSGGSRFRRHANASVSVRITAPRESDLRLP
jgi:hypothetical protein